MTRRSRLVASGVAVVVAIAIVLAFRGTSPGTDAQSDRTGPPSSVAPRGVDPAFGAAMARTGRVAKLPFVGGSDDDSGEVTIAGTVVDARTAAPVGNVEVVFRSEAGEETVIAGADGRYKIAVARGRYHAFVRDESVLSVGRPDGSRLPSLPSADVAGVPDEGLMPIVVASRDADAVDLSVVRGGTISGEVIDARGAPVAGAVVRARGGAFRPALGTDVAETDAAGKFELHMPSGSYMLEATHARYAGVSGEAPRISIAPGSKQSTTLTMTAGCVVAGRVVDAKGKPSSDGAIEMRWGASDLEFGPAGRIEADGTFRWVTTDEVEVTLRAWPWKSPPSPSQSFSCRDGARFTNVVFQLQNRSADIEGRLVDESGAPVPFAFIDLAPQTPGGIGQQERTDADGHWQVFSMPPGQYRISASAPGHGVGVATVTSPARDVEIKLGGVGRVEGTTTLLANGSFELSDVRCSDTDRGRARIAQQHRIVQVVGGHFTIEDMPACNVLARATWRDQNVKVEVDVEPGQTAMLELEIGPPHGKTVHGTVRDDSGRPVADAVVSAAYRANRTSVTRTDDVGRFTLQTFSGATITADAAGASGMATVGMANVDDELVDVTLGTVDRPRGWDD